jgi:hypothetical protein
MQRIRYQAANIIIDPECPLWVGQKATFSTVQRKVRFALAGISAVAILVRFEGIAAAVRPDELDQKVWMLKKIVNGME